MLVANKLPRMQTTYSHFSFKCHSWVLLTWTQLINHYGVESLTSIYPYGDEYQGRVLRIKILIFRLVRLFLSEYIYNIAWRRVFTCQHTLFALYFSVTV